MTTETVVTHVVKQGDTFLPILKAIHSINPTEAVPFQDIISKALEIMKLDLNCMGVRNDRPAVYTPFSNGGMELRARGFMVGEGRAWRLTDSGRAVAISGVYPKKARGEKPIKPEKTPKPEKAPKAAKAAPTPVVTETFAPHDGEPGAADGPANEPDPVFAPVTAAVAAPPVVAAAPPAPPIIVAPPPPPPPPPPPETVEEKATRLVEGTPAPATENGKKAKKLSVIVEAPSNAPEWTKDGYLRALVAANTPCYGAYSPKVKTCETCPLVEHCQRAQATALSVLAGVLKDKADKASKLTTTEISSTHGVVAAALTHGRTRTDAGATAAKLMSASFDGVCARSGETITKGDKVYYVPGEGLVSEKAYQAATV